MAKVQRKTWEFLDTRDDEILTISVQEVSHVNMLFVVFNVCVFVRE